MKIEHWHQEVKTRWLFIAFITFAYRRLSHSIHRLFSLHSFIQFMSCIFALRSAMFLWWFFFLLFLSSCLGNCFFDVIYLVGFAYRYIVCSSVSLVSIENALLEWEINAAGFKWYMHRITCEYGQMQLKHVNLFRLVLWLFSVNIAAATSKSIDYTMLVIIFLALCSVCFVTFQWVFCVIICSSLV